MATKRIDDATRPDLTTLESGYKLLVDSTTSGTKKMDLSVVKNVDNHIDGTTNKVFTGTEKTKLSGIAVGANNYEHPANHPPSIITQDLNNRFVTDSEKSTWNNKSDFGGSYNDLTDKPSLGSISSKDFWTGTQAAYDLLTPDGNTLYIIIG